MQTDDLIRSLAGDVAPIAPHALQQRIAVGIAGGAVVTLILILLGLGVRPDLTDALHGFSFWMKALYTATIAVGAILATVHLARPDAMRGKSSLWLLLPVAALSAIAANQLLHVPQSERLALWLGQSWRMCSALVLLYSVPIFAGLLWAFRRMAPTRLRSAGAAAGLASGACAATIYSLHCPEVSAAFVLTWYSLGIGLAAALGAILGPRLLRW